MPHQAVYVGADNKFRLQTITETYVPGPGQSLVRVQYSGINPADYKHSQELSINDTVTGYDYSGTVLSTGPGSAFTLGDKIAGSNATTLGRPQHQGAHQDILVADEDMAFAVPPHLPLPHAACLTVIVRTAADAFIHLRLPNPLQPAPASSVGPLLVWGGASAVGLAAIQLARAAGIHPILTTASPANHELLLRLGATRCFDYRAPDVVEQVRAYLAAEHPRAPLRKIFDAVSVPPKQEGVQHTTELAVACAGDGAGGDGDGEVDVVTASPWKNYIMPIGCPERRFEGIAIPGGQRLVLEPRLEDAKLGRSVLAWVVQNYGTRFEMPKVEIVPGSTALQQVLKAGEGAVGSFGKIVIEHPIS